MSDIVEGIGGAIEGALFGRAVEKEGGTKGETSPPEPAECPNCGTMTAAAFCPDCGQKQKVHRTLAALFHDLIHGVLHLDGKFWNTIPLLIFRPGKLTRRYIDGERAKFVSPMAMFLFSVFAMFAVFQMLGISAPSDLQAPSREDLTARFDASATQLEELIAQYEESLESGDLSEEERARVEGQLAFARSELEDLMVVENLTFGESSRQTTGAGSTEDGETVVELSEDGTARMTIDEAGLELLELDLVKKWQENPSLMLYKLQANAYKFSWLLVPLSIPFVWFLFLWKRRFKAYDHAIFVTYSLSFISLLFITSSLIFMIPEFGPPVAAILMIIVTPIHLYKQLRHTYELSRWSALWRLFVLSACIWIVLVLFLQVLLLLGAF